MDPYLLKFSELENFDFTLFSQICFIRYFQQLIDQASMERILISQNSEKKSGNNFKIFQIFMFMIEYLTYQIFIKYLILEWKIS